MKTILVTGAAGYIGRHVVKNALDRGYKVIAICPPTSHSSTTLLQAAYKI